MLPTLFISEQSALKHPQKHRHYDSTLKIIINTIRKSDAQISE